MPSAIKARLIVARFSARRLVHASSSVSLKRAMVSGVCIIDRRFAVHVTFHELLDKDAKTLACKIGQQSDDWMTLPHVLVRGTHPQ